jgi:hypothetical protein
MCGFGVTLSTMSRFVQFWRQCAGLAFRGSSSFANDWQWVFGVPIASGIGVYIAALRGATEVTTGYPTLDGFIAAFAAFSITWIVAFIIRTIKSASELYFKEKDRADALETRMIPKIAISYDESVSSCNDVIPFDDGTKNKIFRLKIENTSNVRAMGYEGWAEISEFPKLSAMNLFWIDAIPRKSIYIDPGRPRFLQILRVSDANIIKVATCTDLLNLIEFWSNDKENQFLIGKYHFKIGLKGDDEVDTMYYTVEFDWTGDWKTAGMKHVNG